MAIKKINNVTCNFAVTKEEAIMPDETLQSTSEEANNFVAPDSSDKMTDAQQAEEIKTPEQKRIEDENEYRAHTSERRRAAQERIKPIIDLLRFFDAKMYGEDEITAPSSGDISRLEGEHKSNAKLVGLIAKTLSGVSYATVAERTGALGEGIVNFQLWNEEPWLGMDNNKFRVDRGENGSNMVSVAADENETYKVLEQLNAVGVPSKAAVEFPDLEGRTTKANGSSRYGDRIRYVSDKYGLEEDYFPLVLKIDTTPRNEIK